MTQITSFKSNPYQMFKTPQLNAQTSFSADNNTSSAKIQQQPAVEVSSNAAAVPKEVVPPVVVQKNNKKKIAFGALGAVALATAGVVVAVKTGKLDLEKIKNKIPILGTLRKIQAESEASTRLAQETMENAQKMVQEAKDYYAKAQNVLEEARSASKNTVQEAINAAKSTAEDVAKGTARVEIHKVADNLKQTAQDTAKQTIQANAQEVAERVSKSTVRRASRRTDGNFVAGMFGLGLIAKGVSNLVGKKDSDKELIKLAYEKEAYMMDKELPATYEESKHYNSNFNQNILPVIQKTAVYADRLNEMYDSALRFYPNLKKEDYTIFREDGKTKQYETKLGKADNIECIWYDKNGVVSAKIIYNNGKPVQIEKFKNGVLEQKARFSKKKDSDENYMSHFFKYDIRNGVNSGTIVYNQDGKAITYLARNNNGQLRKIFNINPDDNTLKTVCLPDDKGKKCLKRYKYDENGDLKEAWLGASNDMPKRCYFFSSDKAKSVSLFAGDGKTFVDIPFEATNDCLSKNRLPEAASY